MGRKTLPSVCVNVRTACLTKPHTSDDLLFSDLGLDLGNPSGIRLEGNAVSSVRPSVCLHSYLLNRVTFDLDLLYACRS